MEAIGPPEAGVYADLAGTLTQRRWLSKLGLVPRVLRFSMQHLWAEFAGPDLAARVPVLEVPALIVSGAAGHICDAALTERYVAHLRAPWKEHVPFGSSGHLACFEEPERFASLFRELAAVGTPG